MFLTDTHSHIYLPEFDDDRNEVMQRAIQNKVEKIFLPNIDSGSISSMMKLCREYPASCYPMMGLHPGSVKESYMEELEIVEKWLDREKFYGIGEAGIDLYWDKSFREQQIKAFSHQVQLSLDHELPLIIHTREAFSEVFSVLHGFRGKKLKGIFHSFTGSIKQAEEATALGFKLGINGIVSFKNSGLDKTVAALGADNLVLETDSPYLAPVPKRGKRNESSYLAYIAKKVAEACGTNIETIAEKTNRNALELFGI